MAYSSIYFSRKDSTIHYWEYENDEKVHKTAPAPLYFFVEADSGEYKTIFGKPAKRVDCSNWSEYQNKVEKFKDMGMKLFESDVPIETKFVISNYLNEELKTPKFNVFYIDIEVHSEEGFPAADEANHPVTVITVWSTKEECFYIFAEKHFDTKFLDDSGEKYKKCIIGDEKKLLKYFMKWLTHKHPDILSGWNSNGFDIPYLVNRVKKIISEKAVRNFSPIGVVKERMVRISQTREEKRYEIAGIACLDMLEVFQNYTFSGQESWKLDFIAEQEIGEKKIHYDGSLSDLYNKDWQKYVEYNVQDTRLLKKLEDKKGFLNILAAFCYGCRVPFEQYQKTTKVLDGAFISQLAKEQIVLPDVNRDLVNKSFPGGFVKDPQAGAHNWIVSFDATSLYPSIMMGWNISPETKKMVIDEEDVHDVLRFLEGDETIKRKVNVDDYQIDIAELCRNITDRNLCVAANGSVYSQDSVGVVPRFVKEWFNMRKFYKNKMLEAKSKKDSDSQRYYDNLQLNYKILINSVYGYLSTIHSRLYDIDNAKAVTLTGQEITKTTVATLNQYFNGINENGWLKSEIAKKSKAKVFDDFIIYGDTDSVYTNVGRLLESMNITSSNYDDKKVCDIVNYKLAPMIADIIQEAMVHLTTKCCRTKENMIFFKRESIARRGIFLEKKKYVMWEINGEGDVPCDKLKSTGVEIVRSSTPPLAKKFLKQVVFDILKHMDKNEIVNELREVRNKFLSEDVEKISFPRSANNVKLYTEKFEDAGVHKQTPIHIRGAIEYNILLNRNPKLKSTYDLIHEGDKIKFVYMKPSKKYPNNILAFKDRWVHEFGLDEFIDRESQFDKSVLSPLDRFFELLNWEKPNFKNINLMELFS